MPEYFYVYPAYLAKNSSRSLGRRVPAAEAPADVSVEAILDAARTLGYKAEGEPGKQYPRQFHTYAGRVKVMKKPGVSKARFLRDVARELKSHPRSR
jgi:signal recognition particle subunit SRP19